MKVRSEMLKLVNQYSIIVALVLGAFFLVPSISMASSIKAALFPSDPDFGYQQYLNRIRAQQAWDIVFNHTLKRDVVVAILDTGVDLDHPDLKNSIWKKIKRAPITR